MGYMNGRTAIDPTATGAHLWAGNTTSDGPILTADFADYVAAVMDVSDITTGTIPFARLPTGTTGAHVAVGNHTHAYSTLTSVPANIMKYKGYWSSGPTWNEGEVVLDGGGNPYVCITTNTGEDISDSSFFEPLFSPPAYPTQWEGNVHGLKVITGSPLSFAYQGGGYPPAGFGYQAPSALNDEVETKFFLAAGSYTLTTIGVSNVDHGIVEFFVDGVSQGTYDYNLPFSYARYVNKAITVLTNGPHVLRLKIVGSTSGNWNLGYSLFIIK